LILTLILARQDSITGVLLAGTGHISEKGKKNFLVVDSSASASLLVTHSMPNVG
jgi:V-type H+-transporting ATPase subunit F